MSSVLITGCSSGFGLLSALEFARQGHEVHATMRNLDKSGDLEKAAADEGLDVQIHRLDVNDKASIEACVGEVGDVDVLVNNAGFEIRTPLEEASDEEIHRQFDTNVYGVLRMIRAVVPGMRRRGSGVVVNVSSVAGIVTAPFTGLYSASKHAVEALSEALHYELGPFGVRVAVVEPGGYETSFQDNVATNSNFGEDSPYWDFSERFQQAIEKIVDPENRQDPQEVADLIVKVATDPKAPLRSPVGDDAEMIIGVRSQGSFEDFERTMREAMDYWEGYDR